MYLRLGITNQSSYEGIKKAYRLKAFETHPDRNHSQDARQRYDAIAEAYATLSDPVKREEYDKIHWIFKGKWQEPTSSKRTKVDITDILDACKSKREDTTNWNTKGTKIDVYV